jgi:hypothetical protein
MAKTDYQKTGTVELKSNIFSVILIIEDKAAILENEDIYEFYFIEDIFKFCMVGKMTFNDRYNIFEYGPFTGNEQVILVYSVGSSDRQIVFDVWKVGRILQAGPGIQETNESIIEISFVDPFYSGLNLRKYSRSWTNQRYTDIMRNILNNMVFIKQAGTPLNIEESTNSTDFIIPYWTPVTAMRFLMRRAVGQKSGTGGYVCYNNTKNTFTTNLLSLNYLLEDFDRTLDRQLYQIHSTELSYENKILEWWINFLDRNAVPRLRGGFWRGYDFQRKKLLNQSLTYSKASDDTIMLGRRTLFNKMNDLKSSNVITGDNSEELLSNISYNDWAKRYNLQMIVNLVVEGNEKRFAGQQIEIDWRSHDFELVREQLKGKYLIKSVTHSFTPGKTYFYRQRLTCIKNAYHDSGSRILYDAKKTNMFSTKYQQVIRRQ